MQSNVFRKLVCLALVLVMVFTMSLPTAFAIEDEMNSADDATPTIDAGITAQIADESTFGLEMPNETSLTEADLERGMRSIAKKGSKKSVPDHSSLTASQLDNENEMSISARNSSQARSAAANNGFYQKLTDYITAHGQYKYIYPIAVYPGEVLQIQVDMPNSAQLDYDAYLYEVDSAGAMTLVDYSEYSTYINGTSGTIAEAVGAWNRSSSVKEYAIFVQSYIGSSISQPFSINVGINSNSDTFETDESAGLAITFTLQAAGLTTINLRSMDTLCDNDWYTFVTPSSKSYTEGYVTLDSASRSAGHKVDVYTLVNGASMKQESNINGRVTLANNTRYYVRVSSTGASTLTGANYNLIVSPSYMADQILLTEFGGGDWATYYGNTYYRVNGAGTITVKGIAGSGGYLLPNATITVTVMNPSWTADSQRYRKATVVTDGEGKFTANISLEHAVGSYSCVIGSAIHFMHYYDIGGVYAQSGNLITDVEPIYIFAYSIMI